MSAAVAEVHRLIRRFLTRPSWPEASEAAQALRTETVGGVLLLVGTVVTMVMANSRLRDAYERTNDLPARAALCLPQPAAALLGGRLVPNLFLCCRPRAQARVD